MKRRAPIQTGPQTWAMAREDYLRGETGPVVCARYGIRIDAFRARCWREGWSKRGQAIAVENRRLGPPRAAAAGAHEARAIAGESGGPVPASETGPMPEPIAPPVDPRRAVQAATQRAAAALKAGRAAEAQALIKAADALAKLHAGQEPMDEEDAPPPEDARKLALAIDDALMDQFLHAVWEAAGLVAREMLAKTPAVPSIHARALYAWRAKNLPPEHIAHDFRRAKESGWATQVFDDEGRVLPLESATEFRQAFWKGYGLEDPDSVGWA